MDIETTGLNEIEDDIIEVGALHIESGEVTESFFHLVQRDGILPEKITKLTGITQEMLDSEGRELEDVLQELIVFISNYPIVAHNAAFDMAFIRENCLAFDIQVPKNRVIDTLEISKRQLPNCSHRLEDLVKYFQLPFSGSHRCQVDCENLLGVYQKLIELGSNE